MINPLVYKTINENQNVHMMYFIHAHIFVYPNIIRAVLDCLLFHHKKYFL